MIYNHTILPYLEYAGFLLTACSVDEMLSCRDVKMMLYVYVLVLGYWIMSELMCYMTGVR